MTRGQDLRNVVKNRYGALATQVVLQEESASCCGPSCCGLEAVTADIYEHREVDGLPTKAVLASLGCGNPTALAELQPGETVLDLGSGGGIDVLLSARRVGPTGHVYGLDMTDEMLALARSNQREAGLQNVEFLKGEIEAVPLPDASVDVVISNCVINLAADKRVVLAEAFRVLKPGGRFAVSDIVRRRDVAPGQRTMELWTGCLAGSLHETDYRAMLADVGFDGIDVEPTRVYSGKDAHELLPSEALDGLEDLDGVFMSAFVRAVKPR